MGSHVPPVFVKPPRASFSDSGGAPKGILERGLRRDSGGRRTGGGIRRDDPEELRREAPERVRNMREKQHKSGVQRASGGTKRRGLRRETPEELRDTGLQRASWGRDQWLSLLSSPPGPDIRADACHIPSGETRRGHRTYDVFPLSYLLPINVHAVTAAAAAVAAVTDRHGGCRHPTSRT